MKRIKLSIIVGIMMAFASIASAATVTKGLIGAQDFNNYDGVTNTFTRPSSTGGTLTLNKVGHEVDALILYGSGVNYTKGTIDAALNAIGTTNKATLLLRPGTWVIDANTDWSAYTNVTFRIVPGVTVSYGAYTLNIPNPEAGLYQWLSGTGAVTFSGNTKTAHPVWMGADPTGTSDSLAKIVLAVNSGVPVIDGDNGLYKITGKIPLISNITVKNMRLFDPAYRTTGKHNFLEAVGTVGTNLTNIHLDNIKLLGNNSTYAVVTDTWSNNAYGWIDGIGIFFRYVTGGTIRNIECDFMESCTVINFSTGISVDSLNSTQAEADTHTGFTFGGSFDSTARNIRIYNGGDGALFIYNGSNCHIRDSLVKNTTPATYSLAGAGIETAVGCSLDNVKVEGAWAGFALTEANTSNSLRNSHADGCHVGVLIGPYGYGYYGAELQIVNNRITGMVDLGQAYPVSGILVYNTNNTYATEGTVSILGNYIGRSSAGIGIYVDAVATKEAVRYLIANNTIEASTLTSLNWETQVSAAFSTDAQVMYLKGLKQADITGNRFRDRDEAELVEPSIQFVGCEDINFHGNSLTFGGSATFVASDAASSRISAINNYIIALPAGGNSPFTLLGTDHIIKDNPGWGESLVTGSNATVTAATGLVPYGFRRMVTAENQIVNLPAAVPRATGTYGNVAPLEFVFTSTANTLTVHPVTGDTIRGLAASADDTVTAGTTKIYTCYITGFWEIR
ncbi:MAG: right-handed parallel beta-helix repeat-containing protein [Desulfuromonadaceae bacterium]